MVTHRESTSRAEKDFFVKEVQLVRLDIDKLKLFCDSNKYPFAETKRLFKDANEKLHLIKELLMESSNCKEILIAPSVFKQFQNLRNLITNVSPNSNGDLVLSPMSQRQVERNLASLKKELGKFILRINS